jgi:murein DD-endopeptidase MepM/ murein hydrolase activator NlpD
LLSNLDPFDQLGLGTSPVRRRDLRERSTSRSRRAARNRADADRRARKAVKSSVSRKPASGPSGSKRPPKKPVSKRIAKFLVSVVALSLAAAFAIATAGSPLLFSSASATASVAKTSKASSTINGQHVNATAGQEATISRDSVAALSAKELYSMEVGGLDYTVNNSGVIRWPFNSAVPLGDHFGYRPAPCKGCSTFHKGTDFETGDGAPIYAIAAGTVTISEKSGSLGQHVAISHVINGHAFTSIYGHMRAGSEVMQVGDVIKEGQVVGLTGSTGESTGPHLDFEIDINGVPTDSFVWLKANTAH